MSLTPDDFEAIYPGENGLEADVDAEGIVRLPMVPRQSLLVIQVETLERMLTMAYGEGLSRG